MHIQIVLTEQIINECLALHYNLKPAGKKLKQRLLWIPLILILISVYLIYNELQRPALGQNFFLAILYIAFAFCYYFYMKKRMLKAGKQFLKSLGENAVFEMEVTDEIVTTLTQTSTLTNNWSVFTEALISKENVLLYQANSSFTMFNQIFFRTGEFEEFKYLIREEVRPVIEA